MKDISYVQIVYGFGDVLKILDIPTPEDTGYSMTLWIDWMLECMDIKYERS